jgi:hypothetical protein
MKLHYNFNVLFFKKIINYIYGIFNLIMVVIKIDNSLIDFNLNFLKYILMDHVSFNPNYKFFIITNIEN